MLYFYKVPYPPNPQDLSQTPQSTTQSTPSKWIITGPRTRRSSRRNRKKKAQVIRDDDETEEEADPITSSVLMDLCPGHGRGRYQRRNAAAEKRIVEFVKSYGTLSVDCKSDQGMDR